MAAEHLVVTGRSGAGVSTTAVNLSAALAEQGYRVVHLGYGRRTISTGLLLGRSPLRAACVNACQEACSDKKFPCATGFQGMLCIECGLDREADAVPEFSELCRMGLMARFSPEFVVHDISGDPETVLPILHDEEQSLRLFLVTSADFAALTTLNSFFGALRSSRQGLSFAGVIANNISGPFFQSVVDDFAREAGIKPIVSVPRSLMVSVGEYSSQTVLESAPRSHLSSVYRKFARLAVQGLPAGSPRALEPSAFAAWQCKWSEITEELESGMVRDGAAI